MTVFTKIAVIGAGTMGSGIAAQIANAGHDVLLLDLAARDGADKSPAEMAIDRLMASDPPQLMHKQNAAHIHTGTIDGDFDKLADADWIIEAVVERLDTKKPCIAALMRPSVPTVLSAPTPRPFRSACWSKTCRTAFASGLPSPITSTRFAICGCWNWSAATKHATT